MKITVDTVAHYARLAQLSFDADEAERMARDMGSILDYVAKIEALDLPDTEATSHVFANAPLIRPDEARPGIGTEAAIVNAPDAEAGHFLVPKVIKVR